MSNEIEILKALITASAPPPGTGAGRQTGWAHFLAQLSQATRADHARLDLQLNDGQLRTWVYSATETEIEGLDSATRERMRPERVYSQVDLPMPSGAAQLASAAIRAIRLRGTDIGSVTLVLHRTSGDFRAVDGVQLDKLVPYLHPALTTWQRQSQLAEIAAIEQEINLALGAGWIIFAPTGRVLRMSSTVAARLLPEAGIVYGKDGWLTLRDPRAAARFRQAISDAADDRPSIIALVEAPRVQIALKAGEFAGEPVVIGRLRRNLTAQTIPAERICAAFNLSPSAARLAARLADGMTLQSAADELGWTIETARSCSKQIFARIGDSGQPALVRRLLESAIWFD
ncbi:helix-turn-helix transcriptional regulator [Albirhodobacter sp. R86504]|uniref:helix-turn-helix transcriptional regulator n=1 Tax=Albirhodobacter sp. R86504 TaxID=3093848 RepID=UPI00367259D3